MGSLDTIGGTPTSGTVSPVSAPSPTAETVSAGASFSPKTFGSFIDSGGRIASYVATTTSASGSTSWGGSGLGAYSASGSADGDAGTLSLTARDAAGNDLATASHTFDRASAGTGSWEMVKDIDLLDVTTAAAISGSGSIAFESNSDTITVNRTTTGSGVLSSMTPTNGQGIVYSEGVGNGTGTLSILISDVMSDWDREEASKYMYAVQLVVTGITYPVANTSVFQFVLNRGNTTVFNSGAARGWRFVDNGDGVNENLKIRNNGSTTTSVGVQAIRTSKVITWIILGGSIIHGQQTAGTSLPTPAPGASSTFTLGGSAVGANDNSPTYVANGLRVAAGCLKATQTLTRIAIRRFK